MWSMPREAEGGPHLWNGVLSWKYWPLDSYFTSVLHVFRDTVLHSVATGLGPGAVRWASCLTSAKAARVCVSVIQCGASLGSLWWKELKINGNTLNSVNFGSGSHSIRVAVLIWNALFQPWLRLILYNSKPHGFCSWNWKGLRQSQQWGYMWTVGHEYSMACPAILLLWLSDQEPDQSMRWLLPAPWFGFLSGKVHRSHSDAERLGHASGYTCWEGHCLDLQLPQKIFICATAVTCLFPWRNTILLKWKYMSS